MVSIINETFRDTPKVVRLRSNLRVKCEMDKECKPKKRTGPDQGIISTGFESRSHHVSYSSYYHSRTYAHSR